MSLKSLLAATALSIMCASLPQISLASEGGSHGGGGDASEMGVDQIRADLLQWIADGHASELKFASNLSEAQYVSLMKPILKPHAVVVSFVTTLQEKQTNDPERMVIVGGVQKSCRGFISRVDHRPHILCNTERYPEDGPAQYRLIHHEFAGLVGAERNQGGSSDYALSEQISNKLTPELVYRLCTSKAPTNAYGVVKYLFWLGDVVLASVEQKECEGKMLLMNPRTNSILAEAKETTFTTTPDGQALCGENAYLSDHVAVETYATQVPDTMLLMTNNSSSNYHNPVGQIGDLMALSTGDLPTVLATCKNCSAQLDAELKRVLSAKEFALYQQFTPQQTFSKTVQKGSGLGILKADLGGVGCWWDPGTIKIATQIRVEKNGQDLKLRILSAKVSGDTKSCKSAKSAHE